MLTVSEATKKLKVSRARVYQLINSGALSAKKFGNVWMISESSVNARANSVHKSGRPRAANTHKSGGAHVSSSHESGSHRQSSTHETGGSHAISPKKPDRSQRTSAKKSYGPPATSLTKQGGSRVARKRDIRKYTLMNRDYEVLNFSLNANTKQFVSIDKVCDIKHAPIAITSLRGKTPSLQSLTYWWKHRSIPVSRPGVASKLAELGLAETSDVAIDTLGFSLSDQYWIKPRSTNLEWGELNYFDNAFGIADTRGKVRIGGSAKDSEKATYEHMFVNGAKTSKVAGGCAIDPEFSDVNMLSGVGLKNPDNTSEGELPKKWVCVDGDNDAIRIGGATRKEIGVGVADRGRDVGTESDSSATFSRILLKGAGVLGQEPHNEVLATRLFARFLTESEYVKYAIASYAGKTVSACPCFLKNDEEYVPAHYVLGLAKKPNHINQFQHYINCCAELGVDVRKRAEQMILLDFVLMNHDRHFRNFGLIRNVNTLEWRLAPLFDSGSSLLCNVSTADLKVHAYTYNTKPFYSDPKRQLRLVGDMSWVDCVALREFAGDIEREFSGDDTLEPRVPYIVKAVNAQINLVELLR